MKANIKAVEQDFTPFILEIKVESNEEAQALYAVFNHSSNARLFKDEGDAITEKLEDYQVTYRGDVIANGVTHGMFY